MGTLRVLWCLAVLLPLARGNVRPADYDQGQTPINSGQQAVATSVDASRSTGTPTNKGDSDAQFVDSNIDSPAKKAVDGVASAALSMVGDSSAAASSASASAGSRPSKFTNGKGSAYGSMDRFPLLPANVGLPINVTVNGGKDNVVINAPGHPPFQYDNEAEIVKLMNDTPHNNHTLLWDDAPKYNESQQNNCWLKAAEIVAAYHSPYFVQSLFAGTDSDTDHPGASLTGVTKPDYRAVNVSIFDPHDGSQHWFTADIWNKSKTEDCPDGPWWSDAISQSLQWLAQEVNLTGMETNGTFQVTTGNAAVAMEMVMGLAANYLRVPEDFQDSTTPDEGAAKDALWGWLQKGNSTPILLATKPIPDVDAYVNNHKMSPRIYGEHSYAVFDTHTNDDGKQRMAVTYNPWGSNETFNLDDLWPTLSSVNFLQNEPQLPKSDTDPAGGMQRRGKGEWKGVLAIAAEKGDLLQELRRRDLNV